MIDMTECLCNYQLARNRGRILTVKLKGHALDLRECWQDHWRWASKLGNQLGRGRWVANDAPRRLRQTPNCLAIQSLQLCPA